MIIRWDEFRAHTGRRHTTIQQRNLGRFLVRHGEGIFESAVPISQLVTSPLLRLDALTTDLLAADLVGGVGGDHGVEVVVVVAGELVGTTLGALLLLPRR